MEETYLFKVGFHISKPLLDDALNVPATVPLIAQYFGYVNTCRDRLGMLHVNLLLRERQVSASASQNISFPG